MNEEIAIQDLAKAIIKLSEAFTSYVRRMEKRITVIEYAIDYLNTKKEDK